MVGNQTWTSHAERLTRPHMRQGDGYYGAFERGATRASTRRTRATQADQ